MLLLFFRDWLYSIEVVEKWLDGWMAGWLDGSKEIRTCLLACEPSNHPTIQPFNLLISPHTRQTILLAPFSK